MSKTTEDQTSLICQIYSFQRKPNSHTAKIAPKRRPWQHNAQHRNIASYLSKTAQNATPSRCIDLRRRHQHLGPPVNFMGGWHNICSCTTSLPRLSKAVDYAAMLFFSNGQNGSERHSVFGSVFTDVTTNYQGDLFIHIFREQLFREYSFLCCESIFFTKNPTASQCSWVCF